MRPINCQRAGWLVCALIGLAGLWTPAQAAGDAHTTPVGAHHGTAAPVTAIARGSVDTPHGEVAIQTLRVGDTVLAEDPHTGKVGPERVQTVIVDGVKPLMAVDLSDGSAITVTANHPFWVDSGIALSAPGWIEAGQLRMGDRLRTARGVDVVVIGLRADVGLAPVYTLTVANDHTFFAGEAQVLVHNNNCSETAASIIDKLDRYLLNPEHSSGGAAKAAFFQRALGFNRGNIQELAKQIVFDPAQAVETGVTDFGTKFNQTIEIVGANGRRIPVTFAFIRRNDESFVRLVTAVFPKK